MKKMRFKKLCLGLSIIMVMQLTPTYAADLLLSDYEIRQLMAEQERAVAANDCIVNGMGFLENGTIDYEDDFAGARIEGNKLILSLTDCSELAKEKYLIWAADYTDVLEFEQVDYSYNYLMSKVDDVVDTLYEQTGNQALGYYVSEAKNTIVIKVDEDTHNVLNRQRTAINYEVPVEYESACEAEYMSANIEGGDLLYNINSGSSISVGCCGYFRGRPSIATCGHGINAVGNQFWGEDPLNGYIGSVVHHNFYDGSYGDYAILSGADSDYTYTNKIGATYSITGVATSPAVGTYVYFYGNTTKQYCLGIILERGVTRVAGEDTDDDGEIDVTYTVNSLTGVQVLEGNVQEGDSGGTVFTVSLGTTNANFAGVMSMQGMDSQVGLMMYFTPAGYFTSLGFSVMTS